MLTHRSYNRNIPVKKKGEREGKKFEKEGKQFENKGKETVEFKNNIKKS